MEAEANILERAVADGGQGGSSGAAGPSEASEAAEVPDDCLRVPDHRRDHDRPRLHVGCSRTLRTKDTSPVTAGRHAVESKTVIPNLSLRSMVRSFAEA